MSRIFAIHKPTFKNQYTITGPSRDAIPQGQDTMGAGEDEQQEQHLFVRLRPAINKSPFIVVHDGPDATSRIAAVSHLPPFTKHFQIGLGDPAAATGVSKKQVTDMRWEELRMAHSSGKKHTWAVDVGGEGGGEDGGPRRRLALTWTRTRSTTVDGMTRPPLSTRNWKLTEEPSSTENSSAMLAGDGAVPAVVAVFTSSTQRGLCGHLQVKVDYGREFDLMVFVTCLSLYSSGR